MIMEHCAPRQRLKREGWVEPQFQHQRYYRDRQPQLENLGAYIRKMTRPAAENGESCPKTFLKQPSLCISDDAYQAHGCTPGGETCPAGLRLQRMWNRFWPALDCLEEWMHPTEGHRVGERAGRFVRHHGHVSPRGGRKGDAKLGSGVFSGSQPRICNSRCTLE